MSLLLIDRCFSQNKMGAFGTLNLSENPTLQDLFFKLPAQNSRLFLLSEVHRQEDRQTCRSNAILPITSEFEDVAIKWHGGALKRTKRQQKLK